MGDVKVTASGLRYEIMATGDGSTPGPTDVVSVHYHGTFEDGQVFDSSLETLHLDVLKIDTLKAFKYFK